MEEGTYAAANQNRLQREGLERRRQAAVSTAEFLRTHINTEVSCSAPAYVNTGGWQLPMRNDDLLAAVERRAHELKEQVLRLDQEFTRL